MYQISVQEVPMPAVRVEGELEEEAVFVITLINLQHPHYPVNKK
jgi:hypothetical protein